MAGSILNLPIDFDFPPFFVLFLGAGRSSLRKNSEFAFGSLILARMSISISKNEIFAVVGG